ncbi:MAG: TrmJ/YjtD family RNA methyltransferase [Treponema sp.]|nr:TrmJ/YjtD family RNA methyltransferase [Treponema sp.]
MVLSEVVIILSRPMESGNVGAVCRALKNMGLSRLRIVCPGPLDEGIIQARAVHAGEIWEQAACFDSLSAAIADCALVIGTTRRRGQHRKAITLTPAETAAYLRDRSGPAALVFGNERTGLEAEELGLCNLASHIPAHDAFPSLNLSHAVQLYGYELFRILGPAQVSVKGAWVPLARTAVDTTARSITDSLGSLGFYKQPGREEQERFFRDLISRAGLTEREAAYLADIFAKAARLGNRRGSTC